MFRLVYTRSLNKNLQLLTANSRLLSIYSLSMKSNDNENENNETENEKTVKKDINSLIDDMKDTSGKKDINSLIDGMKDTSAKDKKPFELLQNLMSNVKSKQNYLSKNTRTEQKIKKLSKLKSKQGEDFLFKPTQKKLDVEAYKVSDNIVAENDGVEIIPETTDVAITPTADTIEAKEGGNIEVNVGENIDEVEIVHPDKSLSQEMSIIEMEQLKEDIKRQADNRDVSKLMNALIDDIDEDLPNPEEKLKNLMNAMNKSIKSTTRPYTDEGFSKHTLNRGRGRQRWERVDFNKGPTTNLFSDVKIGNIKVNDEKINLHQKNWIKELDNLLPENVPQNLFEVMMLDIDRQWKFPIDNEQDMGIEDETSFEEHVFLDHFLDEFPDKEPVQKFMELVITGLQQNPYLGVEEKKNRILWFKEYFEKFPDEELSF